MKRMVWALVLSASAAVAVMARPLPQAPTPAVAGGSPAFDVISIKKNPEPGGNGPLAPPVGGRLRLTSQTVRGLISSSYGMQDYQIIGGPAWLRTDGFDIEAIVEGPQPPLPQMLIRIRTLLADRFGLVMHVDKQELPIFRMVTTRSDGRLGPKIQQVETGACTPPPPGGGPRPAGTRRCGFSVGPGRINGIGTGMTGVAQQLGRLAVIGRPVVNDTNLSGQFDWELSWTPGLSAGGDGAPDAISIFTALQEQLGLKLEPSRGPVDVLVIDSVAQPSAN